MYGGALKCRRANVLENERMYSTVQYELRTSTARTAQNLHLKYAQTGEQMADSKHRILRNRNREEVENQEGLAPTVRPDAL